MVDIQKVTTEELKEALVARKNLDKQIERQTKAELFQENGLDEFQQEVSGVKGLEDAYKLANNFTSRYVRMRKVLGLPVGTRGRKKRE